MGMDEDQEPIDRIRVFVDLDDKERESARLAQDRTDGCELPLMPVYIPESYSLGLLLQKTTAEEVERENIGTIAFRLFPGNIEKILRIIPKVAVVQLHISR